MSIKSFKNTRIQIKRDTASNWETNNPVLLNGEEIIVDTSAGEVRKKIGDGKKTYTQLPFTDEVLRTQIATKVDKISGKGLSSNDYTTNEKDKLKNIEDGANNYTHPNTHPASMIVQDSNNRFVTDAQIASWNTKASTAIATSAANGLMSSSDKAKLDGIANNANNYSHPTYTSKVSGLYKITVDGTGHVSGTSTVSKADITGLGIPGQDTTYSAGTGLELNNNNTFNHTNSIIAGTVKGDNSKTLDYAGTFTIPSVTYDSEGHITATGTTTMTMPARPAIYSHPSTHPASMIVQDSNNRFVTDTQIAAWNSKASSNDLTSHTGNKSNPHGVNKTQIGLSNVSNDAQVKRSEMGVANGVATLDSNGMVLSSQLPSYVDDVIEGYYYNAKFYTESAHTNIITGESGKIYIDLHTNKTYRWSGTTYGVISETLALGETSSTAYSGDKGKANATAIVSINEKLNTIESGANKYTHPTYTAKSAGLYKITVDGTGHVSGTSTVSKADITGLGIPGQDTTYSVATSATNGLMSSTDKAKLDGIANNANNYSHPGYTARSAGLYKITVDGTGHVSNVSTVSKTDITGLGIPAQDTTYSTATSATNGLMSSSDKQKLDGIDIGTKMDKVNPTGSGTFSFGREDGTTIGQRSIVLGSNATASGKDSIILGRKGNATAAYATSIGYGNTVSGQNGICIGVNSTSSAGNAISIGSDNTVSDWNAIAIGSAVTANGSNATAMGHATTASGWLSLASGYYTKATGGAQTVFGSLNIEDAAPAGDAVKSEHLIIVGNGDPEAESPTNSNAHTLDWNGNAWFAGDIYVGSTSGTNKDSGSKKLITEESVNSLLTGKSDVNHTHNQATTSTAGLMSASDKTQVNKISNLESRITAIEEKLKTAVFFA